MIASVVVSAEEPALPEPRFVWQVTDRDAPLGALVIDDLVAGRTCGGVRVAPAVTLTELRELAAAMTLKFAFFGIACGGAKAGVVVPEGTAPGERERRMRAFGAALAPLARYGTYIPGTDLGCSERDLWEIVTSAGLPVGPPPARAAVDTSATATDSGRSAAIAAIAALGGDASGATLGILGYGRVGAAVAARFAAAGGKLVGISTARGALLDPAGVDVAALERLRLRHGDEAPLHYPGGRRVDPGDLLSAGFDVLSPCATTRMIDAGSAGRVRCRVVSPGANAAVTADAETILAVAGVTVIPDFVANAGGILTSHFWPLRLPSAAVDLLLERRFRALVGTLLARAAAHGVSPAELARLAARRNRVWLANAHGPALRHERLIALLARGRVQRALPRRVVTALVGRVAASLGPRWPVAPAAR